MNKKQRVAMIHIMRKMMEENYEMIKDFDEEIEDLEQISNAIQSLSSKNAALCVILIEVLEEMKNEQQSPLDSKTGKQVKSTRTIITK
jgi:hypothetical protein